MSSGREEGEIDSEEDGLRKRINELEEENAEYEKIKKISECYEDKYGNMFRLNDYNDWVAVQRAGQVPTDVSSISSDELPSPKKKKHKRNKKSKFKMHERRHRCTHQRHKHYKSQAHGEKRHHHRRERLLNPYYQSRGIETISLDTTDYSEYERDNYSIATMEIESVDENDENTTLPLSREELRLALGRGAAEKKNNICSLKERLQPEKYIEIDSVEKVQTFEESTQNSNCADNVVELNSEDSISIEERELRLIALRSAIMRKHATRKKRNAEIAYSPTDFDDLLVEPISSVTSDIEELAGDMEISPASSPNLILSPIQCDDEQNSNISLETVENQVDNKPVDMDIESSDSEQEDNATNVFDADSICAQQTHDIPLPAGPPMEGMGMPVSYDYASHAKPMSFDMYMPAMHFSTQVDMPQAILPMSNISTTTMQPLPLVEVAQNVVVDGEEESCIKNEGINEQLTMSASPKSATMGIIPEDTTQDQPEQCSDEEEEEALRALLLSQRQTAKTTKANAMPHVRKPFPASDTPPQIAAAHNKRMGSIIKPQPIPLPLLQTIRSDGNVKPTPTESILKEAVRRLKVKSFARCEEAQNDTQPQAHVPRLKIKAFARCKEFDVDSYVQPTIGAESESSAFMVHASHISDINYNPLQLEDGRSISDSSLHRNTPEMLVGTQSNSSENAVILHATKRHLEKEEPMGRTLRTIELKQGAENCSQHSTENCNSDLVNRNKTPQNYESHAKKPKRTMEQATQATKGDVTIVDGKEIAQESITKEKDANASGEKENKEVSSVATGGNDFATNTVAKAKLNAKVVAKPAKLVEKRKVCTSVLAAKATSVGKTAATAPVKQPVPKAVPPKNSTTPTTSPKVVKPQAQQLKIVKPNKVINKSLEKIDEAIAQKKVDASNQSRILTPTTLPNIKVNRLIIRIGDRDSSSEDEEVLRNQTLERCIGLATVRTSTPDSLTSVLNQNVYGSKYATTMSNSSTEQLADARVLANDDISNTSSAKDTVVDESFEKKLENFLKNIRSKTLQKSSSAEHPRVRKLSANSAQMGTPTAVRSLPIASQEEYKRLVHRMKILEKQKHLKKMQKSLLADAEKYTKIKQGNANHVHKPHAAQDVAASTTIGTQTSNDAPSIAIAIVNEKVAAIAESAEQQPNYEYEHSKQLPTTESLATVTTHAPTSEAAPKNEKLMAQKLHSCETILVSISNSIITRLDKSFQLVNETRAAKIAKMRHELRLKELRLEMEQTQRKIKEEQAKILRTHPEICANNELITKLKQKRAKVLEMALKLGKTVQGDDYRLNNDLKNEITLKTKGLATHIKLVNSIRYCDLDVLDKETIMPTNTEQETSDAHTPVGQQSNGQVPKTMAPSSTDGRESENIEKAVNALPTKEANVSDTANCSPADNDLPSACENAADGQVIAQEESATCDTANVVVVTAHIVETAVASVEEMPAPCDNGKEVLPEESMPEEDNVAVTEQASTSHSLRDYISPLVHLRSESGKWDPNDIICPYELMGQCEDKDCSYRHLTDK
ncbi:uncharacterized protein LOC128866514 [Anastrepha ludens]|uniref:uncharacterized protein LOC128866514 n=1 Tax=Anastrepha ludens TaxID=28586 RepID=UPI0023B16D03|nr:uncharacterized protein LOC128866514 [Anastrepha ludens]